MTQTPVPELLRRATLVYRWAESLVRVGEFVVYDDSRAQLGVVREEGITAGRRMLGLGRLDSLPIRRLVVYDDAMNAVVRAVRLRSRLLARAEIQDSRGVAIATMTKNGMFAGRGFALRDPSGQDVGRIEEVGTRRSPEFIVKDGDNKVIARFFRTTDVPVLLRHDPVEYRLEFLNGSNRRLRVVTIASVPIAHATILRY